MGYRQAGEPRAANVALLRFLRGRDTAPTVLNRDGFAREMNRCSSPLPLSQRLVEEALKVSFRDSDTAFRDATMELRAVEPTGLRSDDERYAFWINVYNALVIDGVRALGVERSIREHQGFFRAVAYQVGDYRYTLDEIENGLLLGNRPLHPRMAPPFEASDPRLDGGPSLPDPRVHFALNCATRSCPRIRPYGAGSLHDELEAATRSFIDGGGVRLEGDRAVLSGLFEFYADDFGGKDALPGWLEPYINDERLRRALRDGAFEFESYDWELPWV